MKKIISTLLSVVLLPTIAIPVFAQNPMSSTPMLSPTQDSANHYSGLFMPANKFNELYGQKDSPRNLSISKDTEAIITVQNVSLNNEQVTFTANIEYNNKQKKLNTSGTLFNSYKQHDGMNSVVGVLTDEGSEFEVLLFEIYNDTQATRAITSAALETTPHLKVYLTDRSNNVLLFEIEIPQELQNVKKINNDLQPPTTNDLMWFVSVIEPTEVKEIPNDEVTLEMIKRSAFKESVRLFVTEIKTTLHQWCKLWLGY